MAYGKFLIGEMSKAFDTGSVVDFFIIVGQSNAEGRGSSASSPAAANGIYVNSSGDITALADPVGGALTGSMWPTFSNEWFTQTGRKSAFIERATGGTALIPDTSGSNWSPSGTLRAATVTAARTAINAVIASPTYKLGNVYFLWCQGESEAQAVNGTTITGSAYTTALGELADYFKQEIPQMVTMGVIQSGRYSTNAQAAAWAEIRDAQDDACSLYSDKLRMLYRGASSFVVNGYMADTVHWNQTALNMAGKCAAIELVKATPSSIPAAPSALTYTVMATPDTTSLSARTVSHTTGASTNALVVALHSSRFATNTTFNISGVTFNGVAMTEVREHNVANGSPAARVNIAIYYIDEAAYGGSLANVTGNVVCTHSNTGNMTDMIAINLSGNTSIAEGYAIANSTTLATLSTLTTVNSPSVIITAGACVSSTITIPTATFTNATKIMDHGLATTKGGSFAVGVQSVTPPTADYSTSLTWSTGCAAFGLLSVAFRGKVDGE